MRILIAFLVGLTVAFIMTPLTKKLSMHLGVVDKPDARKVHTGIMTRLGGLGIYFGFLAGVIVYGDYSPTLVGVMLSSTIIVAVGFIDDVKNISPKMKLLGQIVAAIILMLFGVSLEYITNPINGNLINLGLWGYPITLIWLVGISNAVNLIDGLDGLASGVSGIAALSLAVVSFAKGVSLSGGLALILVGSILGFLRYNFHPAKLFMGDCGSLFLGFILGVLSLLGLSQGTTVIALFIPIMVLGIPILDTLFAIIRRKINHKPIFEADKGHLHHQLLDRGFGHKDTVLFIYGITFLLGAFAVLVTLLPSIYSLIVLIFASIMILGGAAKIGIFGKKEKNNDKTE
ncbi:MAG: MraY family glycosyltransferase [Clostridiales bacterium]